MKHQSSEDRAIKKYHELKKQIPFFKNLFDCAVGEFRENESYLLKCGLIKSKTALNKILESAELKES